MGRSDLLFGPFEVEIGLSGELSDHESLRLVEAHGQEGRIEHADRTQNGRWLYGRCRSCLDCWRCHLLLLWSGLLCSFSKVKLGKRGQETFKTIANPAKSKTGPRGPTYFVLVLSDVADRVLLVDDAHSRTKGQGQGQGHGQAGRVIEKTPKTTYCVLASGMQTKTRLNARSGRTLSVGLPSRKTPLSVNEMRLGMKKQLSSLNDLGSCSVGGSLQMALTVSMWPWCSKR